MLRRLLLLVAVAFVPLTAGAASVDDASCDIALLPAATLLLPYFEVDLDDRLGETTHFTITNVTNVDQIAHVTLWTDRGFPVLDFNIYLTGYDVQSIDLHDVFARGVIAPDAGTGTQVTRRGRFADPNPARLVTACDRLPGVLDNAYVERMQNAFVHGRVPELGILQGCNFVGDVHERAVGYVTIDNTRICGTSLPTDDGYFRDEVLHDNVFIGDSLQLNSRENRADASPLVHIRAMPEAQFERTFYERIEPSRRDARQPLPSQFAVRWTKESTLRIWRDARTDGDATCEQHLENATLDVSDIVVFDEDENAVGSSRLATELPVTSKTSVADAERYPQMSGATSGWMYLDLDRTKRDERVTQNWVMGAMALGNGCTAAPDLSEVTKPRGAQIAPAKSDDSCDIALLPAATLLLPYFEVDLDSQNGANTRFTITNAGARDQPVRVTLWTDHGHPVASFNLFLTGYDVHTIDMRELLRLGAIGRARMMGSRVQERGAYSRRNFAPGCSEIDGTLPSDVLERMAAAFTGEKVGDACGPIGEEHANAIGYATVDVVRNCAENLPSAPEYWTADLAYDNVLLGESEHGPLVHIRALPGVEFPRTFYARWQSPDAPPLDARQPLPGTFAARWVSGHAMETRYDIWRETVVPACADWPRRFQVAEEIVRFDEAENAVGGTGHSRYGYYPAVLSAASRVAVRDSDVFPQLTNGAIGGWVYLNLDDSVEDTRATQNWVVTHMQLNGRFSAAADAAALGNGCSAPTGYSEVTVGNAIIGPARKTKP